MDHTGSWKELEYFDLNVDKYFEVQGLSFIMWRMNLVRANPAVDPFNREI